MSDVKVYVPVDAFFLNRIPVEFREYFVNNIPGGCSSDMKLTVISNMCELMTILGKPIKQHGWKKFFDFLLGSWDSKTIVELPGIGDVYAARLKTSLGNFCSVIEMYKMFLCWGCDVLKFKRFLYWACQAEISNAGSSHIERTVAAFKQKYQLSNNLSVMFNDPCPLLLDI